VLTLEEALESEKKKEDATEDVKVVDLENGKGMLLS